MLRRSILLYPLAVFAWSNGVFGQLPSVRGAAAFEVASIKPSPPATPNPFGFPTRASITFGADGRVDATQATLLELILRAHGLNDFQVTGGPGWMTADRFDIAARPPAGFQGDAQQIQTMLQALLAERFKLRTHSETRDLPVFRLVRARRDEKLGPQLRPSSLDCAAIRSARRPGAEPGPDEPSCRPSFQVDMKAGAMTIRMLGESIAELARLLTSPDTRRVVRDGTGLAGNFDVELTFAPEPLPGFPRLPGSENGTSLVTALTEQLGLRLEADRGPVEVLVIDGAEHPTEN